MDVQLDLEWKREDLRQIKWNKNLENMEDGKLPVKQEAGLFN